MDVDRRDLVHRNPYQSSNYFHLSRVEGWLRQNGPSSTNAEGSVFDITDKLYSQCQSTSFTLGTGYSILCRVCDAILKECEEELIFVTCFWADSASRTRLSNLLVQLSEKAKLRNRKIRVRIGFSSRSLIQKIFHTASPKGHVYKPSQWRSKLGLPSKDSIPNLDLEVKSVFIQPFSVMHPKFVVVDRKKCFLPSCNVSWEDWFEGCIGLEGPLVANFVRFWNEFWCRDDTYGTFNAPQLNDAKDYKPVNGSTTSAIPDEVSIGDLAHLTNTELPWTITLNYDCKTLFLPSQYHRNPSFRPFRFQPAPSPPKTPLNEYTLQLINSARRKILIQTPNITCRPVVSALCTAFARGVSVHIITNRNLMTLEQLVTAGTTTPKCMEPIVRSWLKQCVLHDMKNKLATEYFDDIISTLQRSNNTGKQPKQKLTRQNEPDEEQGRGPHSMPVKSHLKLMVVDEEVVLLGSGNMDRASWFTSQELGVAFFCEEMAKSVSDMVFKAVKEQGGLGKCWVDGLYRPDDD